MEETNNENNSDSDSVESWTLVDKKTNKAKHLFSPQV